MRGVWTICARELRAYFLSPVAYIIMTAFLALNGLVFYLIVQAFSGIDAPGGSVMKLFLARNVFYWFFFLLLMSAITMRLFAEERRSGTLEMLMTAPISDLAAVLGKYCGALLFYAALWAPTLLYVVILKQFSVIDMGPIASGYLYLMLSGAMFLALGTLVSILTRSQIVAAIVSFVLMFGLFAVPIFFGSWLTGSTAGKVLAYMNIWSHADDFGKGLVDTRPIVYYASASALLLFLAVQALGSKKGR